MKSQADCARAGWQAESLAMSELNAIIIRPPDDISPEALARLSIEKFIGEGLTISPPQHPTGVLAQRAGTFVTLRTLAGELRGCVGTTEPLHSTVAEEIIQNAISSATRDPRFPPVTVEELADLTYGVDVLSQPEPALGPGDLDAGRFGVIIETLDAQRRALLLPRIRGIDTVDQQWKAVHQKAGIRLGEPVRVERFTVTRFGKD
ncbi:MAG TPA: AmmeMemoRadiSam system protein A [Blastocatellia bacterium]|nr:AmmeMemoRadiSam system protein A [Blastocatellia bacterium]